jgi:competence protein ComEA
MDGTGKGQIAANAVAAVLLVVGGAYLLRGEGVAPKAPGEVSLDGVSDAPSEAKPGAAGAERGSLYVHVAGAVREPGIYRLPTGSRVAAAVRRAGGLSRRADLTAFNLAATVRDAQQVIVPRRRRGHSGGGRGRVAVSAAAGAMATPGPGGAGRPISLSTATPEQLDTLEGIGPKLAAAIIAYRDRHPGFKAIRSCAR